MPNYAGLADFLGPLNESMKAYNEGQKDKAMELAKQVETLMNAYESQQRGRYQSAQAYRTQQQAGQEAELFPYKKQLSEAEINTEQAQTDWTKQRAGISEAERVTKERENQAIIAGFNQWKITNPDKTIEDYMYEKVVKPSEDYAMNKAKEMGEQVKSEQALGAGRQYDLTQNQGIDKAYAGLGTTAGEVEAKTAISKMKEAEASAELEKMRKEAGISGGVGANGKPLTTLDAQRQMRIDAYKYALSQGMNPLQAYNSTSTRFGISSISSLIGDLNEQNFMETDPNVKANNQRLINSLRGMQEQMIGGLQTDEQRKETETAKQGVADFPYSEFKKYGLTKDINEFVLYLQEQLTKGIKKVRLVDDANRVIIEYNYDAETGQWGYTNMVRQSTAPKQTAKPTQTTKPTQKPAETSKKTAPKPANKSDKDYQDAVNFFKKNPIR